jgi:ankyrin repeat protein
MRLQHEMKNSKHFLCFDLFVLFVSDFATNDCHFGLSEFHAAVKSDDVSLVNQLIATGQLDVNATGFKCRPLVSAAEFGRVAIVQALLDAGADIDATDDLQNTACHLAIDNGHAPVLDLLIQRGANLLLRNAEGHSLVYMAMCKTTPNAPCCCSPPARHWCASSLRRACYFTAPLLAQLLARRIDVCVLRQQDGSTPCHDLISDATLALMRRLLLEGHVDIDAFDRYGNTACYYAQHASDRMLRVVINLGADVDRRSRGGGCAPLQCVVSRPISSQLSALLDCAAGGRRRLSLGRHRRLHRLPRGGARTPLRHALRAARRRRQLRPARQAGQHAASVRRRFRLPAADGRRHRRGAPSDRRRAARLCEAFRVPDLHWTASAQSRRAAAVRDCDARVRASGAAGSAASVVEDCSHCQAFSARQQQAVIWPVMVETMSLLLFSLVAVYWAMSLPLELTQHTALMDVYDGLGSSPLAASAPPTGAHRFFPFQVATRLCARDSIHLLIVLVLLR